MAHAMIRKLVLGVPSRPHCSVRVLWKHPCPCVCTSFLDIPHRNAASVLKLGQVLNRLPLDSVPLASSSYSLHSWTRLHGARLHHPVPPKLTNSTDVCTSIHASSSFSFSSSSSETMEVDAASVSPSDDYLEVPQEALDALRRMEEEDAEAEKEGIEGPVQRKRFKPMCYYFTQGLCTLMEETEHTNKFSHVYPDLKVRPSDLKGVKKQPFEYYLVLDLEGMVEILEFPVVMIDAQTLEVVDRFHRFVRPVKMTEERQAEYIKGKYGKWGLDRVWHDTAVPFTEVLKSFEVWMESHSLYDPSSPGKLTRAAFVTCGNWDVKTKIPEQCRDSDISLSPYFNEWINLKDIYYNFYKQRAGGMLAMLKGLNIPLVGTHHVGLDDAHNITRVLQCMLTHGAIVKISAKRKASDPKAVKWMFQYRVK